jgi:hypothetical protein
LYYIQHISALHLLLQKASEFLALRHCKERCNALLKEMMNDSPPNKLSPNHDYGAALVFSFLAYYHQCEQILRRAGFTRAARAPWSERADWEGFARQVQAKFEPEADPTLSGAVLVLLSDLQDESMHRRRGRVSYLSEPSIQERNTAWLVEIIQEVRKDPPVS